MTSDPADPRTTLEPVASAGSIDPGGSIDPAGSVDPADSLRSIDPAGFINPAGSVELVVFTGLQAAGKTSFYRQRFAATHVHISKDHWPNARNKDARQRRLIEEALRAGRSVVVDNTNPTSAERVPLIALARDLGSRVHCYAFLVTVDEALRRNAGRAGRARIADVGIYAVAKKLTLPGPDEPFDQRYTVQITAAGFQLSELP